MSQKFKDRVTAELRKVPYDERRTWKDIDLLTWWSKVKTENPTVEHGAGFGDSWQHAKSACHGLYGEDSAN